MFKTGYHTEIQPQVILEVATTIENVITSPAVARQNNYLFFKRATDILFSTLFIILVLSWLLPVVAIWIKLDSRGPVFFFQKRLGLKGKIFWCIKLRTMIQNDHADEKPAEENDTRITRAGKFLRKTNIDELPQFFNVFIGNMSLIGPRPHMISDCVRFSAIVPSYKFRSLAKPGITGLSQIKGYRGPVKNNESIITRYYWDAVYVRKGGLWMDLKIIGKTISRGSYNLVNAFYEMIKNQFHGPLIPPSDKII